MAVAFTISLPATGAFRNLAAEVAGKYVEIVGGTPADADALAGSVVGEIASLAGDDADARDVQLVFEASPTGVDVTVQCEGRSAVVTRPLPARKS
jgi:hypothetical protein